MYTPRNTGFEARRGVGGGARGAGAGEGGTDDDGDGESDGGRGVTNVSSGSARHKSTGLLRD